MLTEHQEQCLVIQYCDIMKIKVFAVPNGSNKSVVARGLFKAEGLRSGVPDLMFPTSMNNYHGLFIEMKRVKGGTVSDNQREWIDYLILSGYRVEVCKGFDEAKKVIDEYFHIT